MIMGKREMENLIFFSEIKGLAEKGKIQEAISKITQINQKLDARERKAIMNIYSNAVINYSKEIDWDNICCSSSFIDKREDRIYNHKCRTM